ncbi:MAG: hypothetical protein H6581_20470 [Bacteroidia bacterium]|nr:hypothetical protein [Bacteroidia bacterium]
MKKPILILVVLGAICAIYFYFEEHNIKPPPPPPPPPPEKQNLTETQVTQLSREYKINHRIYREIKVQYFTSETRRVPCTQRDIDFNKLCTGANARAPYGYRNRSFSIKKCCKTAQENISSRAGEWKAKYIEEKDLWDVIFEFVDDEGKQLVHLTVNDNTKKVSEK